ncbi:MAG: starch-binding domain-like protein [Bacteroidetes bacterium]|nr:MAG: starch-binding domain-like protein [Bacteroidota bacterium]
MKKISIILPAIALSAILLAGCGKNGEPAHLTVKMTDAPADYLGVNVDVLSVEIKHEDAWIVLPVNAGIYDLLDLQNNVTAVLAQNVEIPPGNINQVRLILGSQNSIETIGGVFPLATPSGQQTGLKMNLNTWIEPGKEVVIVIDFDAAKSVVEEGNGSFSLKPHLEIKTVTQF